MSGPPRWSTVPFTPLSPDDPQQVGEYRLTGQLGAGGMGIVYLARTRAGTPVALKLIRPEYAADPTFRARFAREVDTGRQVHGVCIARYLDADPEAARPYLVTEYVDGPGLGEVVTARGPFRGAQLEALAAGLAEGLVSLHRAGVVHRDLKPSNVLLANDAPKIIDFGIAHASNATSMTRTGHVVGSAGWMSPEQASGDRVTSAGDVFAWASTIAFAATGRPPFGEGPPVAVIYRVVHQEPDLAGVPDNLLAPLRAAFAKDPAERPEPAHLLAMLTGDGSADPSGEITRLLDLAWVPVAPMAGAAAQTGSTVAAEHALVPPTATVADGARTSGSADHRSRNALIAVAAVLALLLGAGIAWGFLRDSGSKQATPPATQPPAAATSTTESTTTAEPTTTTEAATTTPAPDPGLSWTAIETGLPAGSASTGVFDGASGPVAVTANGKDATLWAWSGGAWTTTGSLVLSDPIQNTDSLATTRLTGAPADDVLVALQGEKGSVIVVDDGSGRLAEFDVPDKRKTVTTVNQPVASNGRVTGRLDKIDGEITWRYDPGTDTFAVENQTGN